MKNFLFVASLAIIALLQVSPISAFNIKQTLKGLTKSSPLITTAIVSEVSAKIEKDSMGNDVIYTNVTVHILTVLKGSVDYKSLIVKMLGGVVNDKGAWSEELIPFKVDEEVLLFLHPKDDGKNTWEMKSASAKMSIINNKGTRCFDCSGLYPDELSKNDAYPYLDEKVITNKIISYISSKKGDN